MMYAASEFIGGGGSTPPPGRLEPAAARRPATKLTRNRPTSAHAPRRSTGTTGRWPVNQLWSALSASAATASAALASAVRSVGSMFSQDLEDA
eukprot:scaffold13116_cov62-Phaeocystis_antarctica.AAC.4